MYIFICTFQIYYNGKNCSPKVFGVTKQSGFQLVGHRLNWSLQFDVQCMTLCCTSINPSVDIPLRYTQNLMFSVY